MTDPRELHRLQLEQQPFLPDPRHSLLIQMSLLRQGDHLSRQKPNPLYPPFQ